MSSRREGINVLGGTLADCSLEPLTGFWRDGCCHAGPEDMGLHTVCVIVTDDFLEHQRSLGNDLITPHPQYRFPGLKAGDRWCVCAMRWLQSAVAGFACPVDLEATHQVTIEYIPLELLREHAWTPPTG